MPNARSIGENVEGAGASRGHILAFLLLGSALLLLLLLASATPAAAVTRFVDGSQPDNAGSNQWSTIQRAIDNATNGDVILVSAGTYAENVIVNKTLSIQGNPRNSTFVQPASGAAFFIQANNVNISALTVRSTYQGIYIGVSAMALNVNSVTFEGLSFAVDIDGAANVTIEASYFGNNSYGIYSHYSSRTIARNNTAFQNSYAVYYYATNASVVRDGNHTADYYAVYLQSNTLAVIDRNHIGNGSNGVIAYSDWRDTISSNRIDNLTQTGLQLSYCTDITVAGNEFWYVLYAFQLSPESDWNGAYFNHSIPTSNKVHGNPFYYYVNQSGVSVPSGAGWVGAYNVTNLTVPFESLSRNTYDIYLNRVNNALVDGLNASISASFAAYVANSNNVTLQRLNTTDQVGGVYLYNVTNATVKQGNYSPSYCSWVCGVYAYLSPAALVRDNVFNTSSYNGFQIDSGSDRIQFINNTFNHSSYNYVNYADRPFFLDNRFNGTTQSLYAYGSPYGRMYNSTITNSTYPLNFQGYDVSHFQWDIPANNTWEGRPFRSYINVSGVTGAANLSWVMLANASNVTVPFLGANNYSSYAVDVEYSSNITFQRVSANFSDQAVRVQSSTHVTVQNLSASQVGSYGVYVSATTFFSLTNSTIQGGSIAVEITAGSTPSDDGVIDGGNWTGVYSYGVYSYNNNRLSVRNITMVGQDGYTFVYAFYGSYMNVSNVTINHVASLLTLYYTNLVSVDRANWSTPWPGTYYTYTGVYAYNVSVLNVTNSTLADFQDGVFIDTGTYHVRLVNDTMRNATGDGVHATASNIGNITIIGGSFFGRVGYTGTQDGVEIVGALQPVNISGLNVSNFYRGVAVDPAVAVNVSGTQIDNTTVGIEFSSVSEASAFGNRINDTRDRAIAILSGLNITLGSNTILRTGFAAVALDGFSQRITIVSNVIGGGDYGILLQGGRDDVVSSNSINGTLAAGIKVDSAAFVHENSTFTGNTITNGGTGFYIAAASFLTLDANSMSGNTYNFRLDAANLVRFYHSVNTANTVNGKPIYYIVNGSGGSIPTTAGLAILANTSGYLVSGLTLDHNWHGVLIFSSSGATVINVNVAATAVGIELRTVTGSTVRDSTVDGAAYGIQLVNSNGNTVQNNTINASQSYALFLSSSNANNLTSNRIRNSTFLGMYLASSSGNVLFSNNMSNDVYSLLISGSTLSHYNHTIPSNNTIDGRAVFYRINTTNVAVPTDASYVLLANVTNASIVGLNLSHVYFAVDLFNSNWINISNTTFGVVTDAVHIRGTANVAIGNITTGTGWYVAAGVELDAGSVNVSIANSTFPYGTFFLNADDSSNISVTGNTIGVAPSYYAYYGVYLTSDVDNVTISGNTFSYGYYGVRLSGTNAAQMISNISVANNSFSRYVFTYSVYFGNTFIENVTVYHNNFNLTGGANAPYDPNQIGKWYRDYPWGGNSWSNYTSPDAYGGAGQNLSGPDGIVDSPFNFAGISDAYPLVDTWPPPILLVSPANMSSVRPGTLLDFYVSRYFDTVKNATNNGTINTFAAPFDINTSGWADGTYHLWVNGSDATGTVASAWFVIAIDSAAPTISALTPAPGGTYATGTLLNFTISDPHLAGNATWNNGNGSVPFPTQWNVTTVGWPDGDYTVSVTAWDTAGNRAVANFSYGIDGNPPVITLVSPANNSVTRAGTTLDLSITDAHFQNASWNSGSGWNALAAPFDISTTGWPDGPTTVTVVAFDVLGRQTVRSFSFPFDSTPPTITLNAPANLSVIPAGTTIDLAITDVNLNAANWTISGAPAALVAPFDIPTTGWADGLYTVRVNATDAAGNLRFASFTFTLDSTPPTITIITPANGSVIPAGTTIDLSISDTNFNVANWTNSGAPSALVAPFDISTTGWTDGVYAVRVNATDLAGNLRFASFTFTLDSTPPTVTLNAPSNGSVMQAGTTIDLAVTDTNFNAANWTNSGAPSALASPFDISTTGWADGVYTVRVNATDLAGNLRFASFTFTVDSTAPAITLNAPANLSVIPAGTTIDLAITDANFNAANWTNSGAPATLLSPFDISTSGWADGVYTVRVNATDLAGNRRFASFTFTIDSTPPTVTLNAPANNSVIPAGTAIDLTISDTNFNESNWTNSGAPSALASPFDISTTGWSDGVYTVRVNATDLAGNLRFASYTFTLDSTPPTITLNSPANNSVRTSGTTIDLSVGDTNLNAATWNSGSGNTTLSSPYDISTSGWAEGDWQVTVRATDLAGNARVFVVGISLDNTAPTIALNQPANGSTFGSGTAIDLSISDLHAFNASWNNGSASSPLAAPFDISTTSWADGNYTVAVNASDVAGNAVFASYSFWIDNAFPAVILNSPANNSVDLPGTLLDFNVIDTDLNAVTWNDGSGSNSLSAPFDVNTTGWPDGDVNVTIVATDNSSHTVEVVFHFVIDSVRPTITLNTPSNNSIIRAGTPVDLAVADANLGSVTWNNSSGAVSLASPFDVPTAGWADGDFNISVVATDLAGNTRTGVFHFTIDTTVPTVTFNAPANNSVIAPGTVINLSISDAHSFSATWNNGNGSNTLSSPFSISTTGWADGGVDVTVAATDVASNVRTVVLHFVIDSVVPAISLNAPANNSVVSAGTTIDLAVSDANFNAANWTTGGAPAALASPFDISTTGWTDGVYTVRVNATDLGGNLRFASFAFTVDSTPPTVTLNAPSNGSTIPAGTSLDLSIADTNFNAADWTTAGAPTPLASPFDISTTGWSDGAYIVRVNATDLAGNLRFASFTFTVDSTPPSVTLNAPSNGSVMQAGTTIDLAVTDTNLNAANWTTSGAPTALASPFDISTTGWSDGVYTVRVNATDLAGNLRFASYTFTLDSTAPTITLNFPANNSVIQAGTTLDLAVSDTNGLASASWNNGSAPNPLASPFDISTGGWADGPVNVTILATDNVGNVRAAVFRFVFDSTPPTIVLNSPANNSVVPAGTPIDLSVSDLNALGNVSRNNGSGPVALTSPFDISTAGWADGALNVTVTASDAAGNVRVDVFRFTFDSTPPTVTLNSPANNSVVQPGTLLDFAVGDANLGSVTWNNGSGPVALTSPFDVATAGWPENAGASTTNVTVVATDLAGNSLSFLVVLTLDGTAPLIALNTPANGSVIPAGTTIDLSVSDAHLSAVTWSNGSGPNALASPYDVATAGWSNGNYSVTVAASDAAGNSRSEVFRFTLDSTPPNITLNAPANNSVIAAGTLLDFAVLDPNLASAAWNNGSGANTLASPFDVNTAGWLDGIFTVAVTASDLAGNLRGVTFRFTLDSTLPTITLNAPGNNSYVAAGTAIDLSVGDVNLNTVSWTNGSGPNTLTSPFDIATPGWPDGSANVTVTATDLAGNSRVLVIHLVFDSTLPAISLVAPSNNSIITAGTTIDLNVVDANLATVTWDNSSGTNSLGSPFDIATAGWIDGNWNVTVIATDLAGNVRVVVLRYTIDSTPPSITLLSPSNNSFVRAGTTLDLLITDLTALTVTWDNGSGPNTLVTPFDINTAGWGDGSVDLSILATDAVSNSRTRVFHFTFDSTLPAVTLLSPSNNSVIRPGVAVNLSITDTNLNTATWDNGGGATGFATQWSIPTTGWSDASYNITIDATDLAGNARTRTFRFTIDQLLPTITLNSPANNSYIAQGTVLNLTITDINLATASWDDGTGAQTFAVQWNISTTGWGDAPINISVYAVDGAGNSRTRTFHFTIDSLAPSLSLLSPSNNSYLVAGALINFSLSDTNLNTATWDNGGGAQSFATQWNISTSGWADGSYNITVSVSDLAGNVRTRVFHFTVDSTLPAISLTTPANDSYVDAGTVLTFAIADTNLNVVTWDSGSGPQSFAAQWTVPTATWPDASYNITVSASDLAGNARTRVFHIWIDSTLPTIALNGATPANGSTFDAGAILAFDVTEAHIASATWNNGTSGNVPFGAPFQVSTAGWQDGVFDLAIRVTDRASHQAYFVYRFTLDSVAPTIGNVSWEGGYFEAGWRLNGTYADTNMAWTNLQVDALPAQNATLTTYQVDTTGLADGAHSIRVQAGDRAGHVTTRVFPVTVDSNPPVIQNIVPVDGSFFRPGTPINFTVFDNNTANVTWQRNAGALLPANGTGGLRNINTSTWGDGNWTVRIFASDLAGHVTSVILTLVTDATPPSMPSSLTANQTYDEDTDTPLNATSAGDGGNPLPDSSFLWTFTDRLGPLALGPLVGRQVTYSGWTQPGDFEYTLTLTDLAGNAANRTYGVHIRDRTAPEIRLSAPSTADEDTPVLLDGSQTTDNDPTFLANDASCAGGRFVIRASDGSLVTIVLVGVGGPNPTACLAPSHTFAEPGVYSIAFNVTDKSGIGNSTTWVIRILDRTAPDVSAFAVPAVVNEGANATLDATATTDNDAENVSLISYTWTVRRVGGATVTRTGALINFTFVDPGDYLVNLSALDNSGNRNSSTKSIRVNDIPVLDNSPPSQLTLPENMDFRLTITDTDAGDSFNVTTVTPAGIAVGNDSLTGRPRLTWAPTTYGPFTINFTLSDGFAWVNYTFNITIRVSPTNNPPPVWDNVALGELRESITYTYDANAHDPAGDTVYYGLTVGPPGMSIDFVTGIVTWYHTLRVTSADQVFDVHIYAWDGANYIWQNYTVRLRATPNRPPVIEAAGLWSTVTVEEGANITLSLISHITDPDDLVFNITATTLDADKVSVEVVYVEGYPALRITGLLQGSATITLRVADGSQSFDTQDIAVSVTPPASGTPGGGGSGIGGLIPLIGLGVGGAGVAGFFIVMRGRNKRKEERPAASAAVQAVAAPTLAAEAGTVVLTAESAAAAAATAVLAGAAAEKKITYTIEGLFVIYKDGRLLYSKTDMGQAKFEDPELVSSMFTAVQSFIKDSFSSEGELNKMGYGDNQIIIERGRSVFTAAIVFGEPDQEFHDAMKAAIENVELSYAGIIEAWDGMMDSFADMDQKLAGVIALSAGITRREVQLATTKQEVLMLSELEFFQGFVRLKCGIKNNTPSVITKATVDIEYNEDVLRLARVEPAAYRTAGAKVLLGVLNPGEKSSVAYYFDPQICTESQIDGVCRYRDATGVLHTVAMKTRKAEVVCPLFFTKEHANTAMLKRLVEQQLGEKDSKVFQIQKIPPYIKHKDVFDLIKSVVNAHDVQMVREFTKFNPFHGEAWFYGETKVKNYKIVIRATVIEETNAIEFFAASTNMKAITGLLAEFNHTLSSMVIEKYSDLKIAQIFDSEVKAEIEKKSLMSNMSSAELEGAETEQGGDVGSPPAPAEQPPAEGKPETEDDLEIPEPEDEGKGGEGKPGEGGA